MFYYDPTFLLLIPALLLSLWAQAKVKSAYAKYSTVISSFPGSAAQAAGKMLADNNLQNVAVVPTQGTLTDHYDPRKETLSLSEGVYGSNSIAALGIAAHEAGHAMQKKDGYAMLNLRTAVVPFVNIGSSLSVPIFILGLIMSLEILQVAGIVLFGAVVVFTLITLPVEFNASKRAIAMLQTSGIIQSAQEEQGVRRVLSAAAMTYVASAVGALLQLARLILLRRRRD